LKDEELKKSIEELAAEKNFPLTKLFQVDGSKRSSHSNAYMYGFWKNKKLVVYDTLIEKSSHDEIIAIVSHELGHWFHSHTLKLLFMQSFKLFIIFWLYGFCVKTYGRELVIDFGYDLYNDGSVPAMISLTVFMSLLTPLVTIITMLVTAITRKFEFQVKRGIRNSFLG
jgi:STE24 endopeptidase